MNKNVQQLVILGVLMIVLVFVTLSNIKKKPAKKTVAPKPAAAGVDKTVMNIPLPTSTNVAATADERMIATQTERANMTWGRDPFNASMNKEFQLTDLKLKGISFSKDRQGYAFINEEIVKSGNKVGDYEIVEVEKDKVLLRKSGQSFYLTFPKE